MADFVLIHGTTQGPTGWDRLVDRLAANGHRVTAVDLIGNDDDRVADYVNTVTAQVPPDHTDPIVVAHSGAGVLLPGVAKALRARHQVWLAAFVPDGHTSIVDELAVGGEDIFNSEWLGTDPMADPVLAAYFLFHDCDLDTLQWALTTLRLFAPAVLYTEPVALTPGIPSTYIVANEDRTLRPDWCRAAATDRLAADVIDLDTGHCPHVSRPTQLAAALDRITRRD